ncbi:MAG: hypothetical protein NVSMB6_10050 [Burkholderiaceae bacterium]
MPSHASRVAEAKSQTLSPYVNDQWKSKIGRFGHTILCRVGSNGAAIVVQSLTMQMKQLPD